MVEMTGSLRIPANVKALDVAAFRDSSARTTAESSTKDDIFEISWDLFSRWNRSSSVLISIRIYSSPGILPMQCYRQPYILAGILLS